MTKPLRRPPAGGYARGDETRRKIIEAAIHLFAQNGFDGASTRDIAARAGVNAPALQYYFENKEGLYRACVESLADESWRFFEPAVLRAREVLASAPPADTAALIEAFIGIVATTSDRTFVKQGQPDQRLFFAREQSGTEPEIGSQILNERMRAPLNAVTAELLARITGRAADDPVTIVRMFSLHGQSVLFYVARRSVQTLLEWKEIDAEKAEFLKTQICEQCRILLRHWSSEASAS